MFVPCACTELFRITIGPLSVPVGTTPFVLFSVGAFVLPGLLRGWYNRRRAARAMARIANDDART